MELKAILTIYWSGTGFNDLNYLLQPMVFYLSNEQQQEQTPQWC